MIGLGGHDRRDCVVHCEYVVLLGATLGDSRKAVAIFEALHRIDAQHGSTQLGVQLAKLWFAQSYGTTLDDTGNDATNGVALCLDLLDELYHLLSLLWIRTAHGIGLRQREVVAVIVVVQRDRAHLRRVGGNLDAQLAQYQLSQRTSHTATDGDTS